METRTVHDPFTGQDVQISDRLVDRLRGKYASGPHLPNGRHEFGWRQFEAPPIQHEAADRIEKLEAALNIIASGMRGDKVLADWEMSNIAAAAVAK
jgi:hypothetical protein